MLKRTLLIFSALLFLSGAASAQFSFSIGVGNNQVRYDDYGYPIVNQQCASPGYGYYDDAYYYQEERRRNRRWRKRQRRALRRAQRAQRQWQRRARANQCPPPGHYYCQQHNMYCNHY